MPLYRPWPLSLLPVGRGEREKKLAGCLGDLVYGDAITLRRRFKGAQSLGNQGRLSLVKLRKAKKVCRKVVAARLDALVASEAAAAGPLLPTQPPPVLSPLTGYLGCRSPNCSVAVQWTNSPSRRPALRDSVRMHWWIWGAQRLGNQGRLSLVKLRKAKKFFDRGFTIHEAVGAIGGRREAGRAGAGNIPAGYEVVPRKWTKQEAFRRELMKPLKSLVTEAGVPVASQAAAAGPLLPTQPPPIVHGRRFQSIPMDSNGFQTLFKKYFMRFTVNSGEKRPTYLRYPIGDLRAACKSDGHESFERSGREHIPAGYLRTATRPALRGLPGQAAFAVTPFCHLSCRGTGDRNSCLQQGL